MIHDSRDVQGSGFQYMRLSPVQGGWAGSIRGREGVGGKGRGERESLQRGGRECGTRDGRLRRGGGRGRHEALHDTMMYRESGGLLYMGGTEGGAGLGAPIGGGQGGERGGGGLLHCTSLF